MSDTDYFKSNYYKPIERKNNDSSDVYTLLNLLVNKVKVLEEKIDVIVSKSCENIQQNYTGHSDNLINNYKDDPFDCYWGE